MKSQYVALYGRSVFQGYLVSQRYSIEDVKSFVKRQGGTCLSIRYLGAHKHLHLKCGLGHRWRATFNSLKNGKSWCPECAGNTPYSLDEIKALAESKKGEFLESYVPTAKEKVHWRCEFGHNFISTIDSIKNARQWCPVCLSSSRLSLQDARVFAEQKSGKCLSKTYSGNREKLLWECHFGHRWNATIYNIKNGNWCPDCRRNWGEDIVRVYFEEIFKDRFIKTRSLDWLRTPKGRRLEIDGYSEHLNIGFEHQGIHHYSADSLFPKAKWDRTKAKLCKKYGLKLFIIPQIGTLTSLRDLPNIVKSQATELKVKLPSRLPNVADIDVKRAYQTAELQTLQSLAAGKEGKLLSRAYLGSFAPLKWQCKHKHQWKAAPRSIKSGSWCPKCFDKSDIRGKTQKHDLSVYVKIAQRNGGRCLSEKYINSKEKLKFECSNGHIFWSRPVNVKNLGRWCPECGVKRVAKSKSGSIEKMHKLAQKNKGKCLSKNYINAYSSLLWKCHVGHYWWARPNNISNGKWCPACAGKKTGWYLTERVARKNLKEE